MTTWISGSKFCFYKLIECIIKKYVKVKQYAKICAIDVMELEFFILGGQRIYQKRKKGWWRGRREREQRGSRERIEIERKEKKGNRVNNLKRRIRNIDICLCLLFSFLKVS